MVWAVGKTTDFSKQRQYRNSLRPQGNSPPTMGVTFRRVQRDEVEILGDRGVLLPRRTPPNLFGQRVQQVVVARFAARSQRLPRATRGGRARTRPCVGSAGWPLRRRRSRRHTLFAGNPLVHERLAARLRRTGIDPYATDRGETDDVASTWPRALRRTEDPDLVDDDGISEQMALQRGPVLADGDRLAGADPATGAPVLQRGPVLADGDRRPLPLAASTDHFASTWPRPRGREIEYFLPRRRRRRRAASTWPRPRGRGSAPRAATAVPARRVASTWPRPRGRGSPTRGDWTSWRCTGFSVAPVLADGDRRDGQAA